ncbi:hypothetical protein X741_19560 [Mesorhizobium sp. LNHC229A00]|jgi:hypothetical protein|nr:hypothetical protein X741_19560 [Mesorhizobium sp. LNHC229A00]
MRTILFAMVVLLFMGSGFCPAAELVIAGAGD